jgi:hypothetical protein
MADPRVATITIPSGQTASAPLRLEDLAARHSFDAMLIAPATLPETTKVQVSMSPTELVWVDLQSAGVDVTVIASKATALVGVTAGALRLATGTAVGADRVFSWRAVARSPRT